MSKKTPLEIVNKVLMREDKARLRRLKHAHDLQTVNVKGLWLQFDLPAAVDAQYQAGTLLGEINQLIAKLPGGPAVLGVVKMRVSSKFTNIGSPKWRP